MSTTTATLIPFTTMGENTQIEVSHCALSGHCSVMVQGENSTQSVILPSFRNRHHSTTSTSTTTTTTGPLTRSTHYNQKGFHHESNIYPKSNRMADLLRHKSPIPDKRRSSLFGHSSSHKSHHSQHRRSPLASSSNITNSDQCDPCIMGQSSPYKAPRQRSSSSSNNKRVVHTWKAAPPPVTRRSPTRRGRERK